MCCPFLSPTPHNTHPPTHAHARTQVIVKEMPRQWYHFLTTLCAIIGGVFTVAGILDSIFYTAAKITKKLELGKQG